MSLTKSATRRVSLLAGSSLIAAALAGASSLIPLAALAANECGNPSANGGAADTLTCTPGPYLSGIDYSTTSDGDLTVVLRDRVDTGTSNTAGTGGVRMYGDTGEDMTLVRQDTPGVIGDPRIVNTAGRAIDVSTQGDGNVRIDLTDGDPDAGEPTTPVATAPGRMRITASGDAVRAEAFGSGNVSVIFTETGVPSGTAHQRTAITAGASGGAGIFARTTSGDVIIDTRGATVTMSANGTVGIDAASGTGDISISTSTVTASAAGVTDGIRAVSAGGNIDIVTTAFVSGRQRGIFADTEGAGVINITVGSSVLASAVDGVAAIDIVAGTGATTITLTGFSSTVNGGAGAAIRATSGGTVAVENSGQIVGRLNFSGVAGGVSLGGTGSWSSVGASTFSNASDSVAVEFFSLAQGESVDFGGGADTFSTGFGSTMSAGALNFGAGADVYNLIGDLSANGTNINFGADADTFNVSGRLNATATAIDGGAGVDALNTSSSIWWNGVNSVSNFEALNHSGIFYLGGQRSSQPLVVPDTTDSTPNDRLFVTGGVYTGSGAAQIVLDANLGNHGSQLGCATPTVADCISFAGGATTAGSTLLTVRDVSFSIDGGTLGAVVTLIDGSTAAEHFTLDPNSSYYVETAEGGVIRKPVVVYQFEYDETNHRHVLVGTPADEPFQVGTFATAAQETWRATTGSWLTRQADLRSTPGGLEASNGVWARVGAQTSEREAGTSFSQGGLTFDYDLGQKQKISHLIFGADLVGGAGWVVGGMVGFARSDVEFDATSTEAVTSGFTGGLYASYVAGPLFIDATANANILHIKADAPAMNLGLDVPMTFDLKSLGGQVEAGWRFGEDLFVEPLVGVSYVVTRIEETEVPGGAGLFDFEEAKSLRLGAGARVGLDSELMGMSASYSLTGRYWNESEGEASATITTASGSSALLPDEFTGGFSDIAAGLSLYSQDGGLSGFVSLGGKFGDGYQAVDGSVGVRVRW